MRPWILLLAAVLPIDVSRAQSKAPTTPEEHLGHALAADFTLPDWNTVRGYYEKLDAESPRVELRTLGKTTEGRDLVLAVISSEANLARLERLKECAAICTDPRGKTREQRLAAVEQGAPFLFVSCAMHATECAAPQFAMQLAWELATSDEEPYRAAREHCVVLLLPSTNPDGLDLVSDWYMRHVGTPFEASELTRLYQLYAGHDNNRDWFTLTQPETRLVTKLLYETWRPHVYWDVHQQGSKAERMFVPPFRDPLDPNLDAGIITAINLLGTRAQLDMTREGRTGVASGGTFDMWWNGGNRNVPVRHNIVGLLTEAASCRLATPIFQQKSDLSAPDGVNGYVPSNKFPAPWPGGWWRIADIVEYEMAFGRSLLGSLARERRFFLENALEASDRALAAGRGDGVQAWILPADQRDRGATRRLVDVLLATAVEVSVADADIVADGRTYPAGSIVIRRDQPYGAHVKDLFEMQRYPSGEAPYDVAGWTLPFLFGVRRVEVNELGAGAMHRVTDADEAVRSLSGTASSARDSDAWKRLFSGLSAGTAFAFERRADQSGHFVPSSNAADAVAIARSPRIGLYAPWTGSMDEGWMRWVFDTFGVKYTTVRNEMLRAGAIGDFLDVLVLPGVDASELDTGRAAGSAPADFTGGLDPEGAVAVEEFVRAGGNLVAVGRSTKWAIDLMQLPIVDVTAAPEAKEFSCPGSILRTVPGTLAPFTTDLDESIGVFFSRGQAFREMTEKERTDSGAAKRNVDVLLRYASTRLLMSGWVQKPEVIEDRGAWVRTTHGSGTVHLFAFRPQYRGWSQAAFQLLFRAMIFEAKKP